MRRSISRSFFLPKMYSAFSERSPRAAASATSRVTLGRSIFQSSLELGAEALVALAGDVAFRGRPPGLALGRLVARPRPRRGGSRPRAGGSTWQRPGGMRSLTPPPSRHPLGALFEAVREACARPVWSRGGEIARRREVRRDDGRAGPGEVALCVVEPGRPTATRVLLLPEEGALGVHVRLAGRPLRARRRGGDRAPPRLAPRGGARVSAIASGARPTGSTSNARRSGPAARSRSAAPSRPRRAGRARARASPPTTATRRSS